MRVIANQRGYYAGKRREPGEEFGLVNRKDFSKSWMVPDGWDPDDEAPAPAPAPKSAAAATTAPAPVPVKVSTETTVTPPATPAKAVNPITGKDI